MGVLIFDLEELLPEGLDGLLLAPELIVFVIDDPLKSVNGLLGCLTDLYGLFFVIVLLIFLVADESAGIIAKLAGRQLGLHQKVCGRGTHLPSKI